MRRRRYLMVLAAAFCIGSSTPHAADNLQLVLRGTYATGLPGDSAEVISIRHTDAIAAITSTAGSVDVLDLSDPDNPNLIVRVDIDSTTGTPNSAAVHPVHDYFLVVTGKAGVVGTVFAYSLFDGELLASAAVGIQPDAVVISPNGKYAVVANEAEGVGLNDNGGTGSLSIIDLSGFNGHGEDDDLVVTPVSLPSLAGVAGVSSGRTDDIARLPIDNSPGTLEPENIAFSHNSRYVFITLQENNAIIQLDVRTREMGVVGAGQTTHAADLINGGAYAADQTLTAFREPDGIAVDQTGRFFVTADEGDTRDGAAASGPRGGRTVSVFDARTGAFIADTGRQIDDEAAGGRRLSRQPQRTRQFRARGYRSRQLPRCDACRRCLGARERDSARRRLRSDVARSRQCHAARRSHRTRISQVLPPRSSPLRRKRQRSVGNGHGPRGGLLD